MNKTAVRWILYGGLIVLYLLHNDLWFWNDPQIVLGLPVGLLYHALFCVAVSVWMVLLVNYAWPDFDEEQTDT